VGLRKKRLPEEGWEVSTLYRIIIQRPMEDHVMLYSIRAWRSLRYNEKYASKLERKLAKRREHQRASLAPVETNPAHQNVNPFSVRYVPRWRVLRAD
jgi:hypothetical protein